MVYAVRMHGSFPSMKVRAIPAQKAPYPTLAEAAQDQSVYTYTDSRGSVVGFYTPVFLEGLNVPGFHLHYLSNDRQTGGHILDFTVPENTHSRIRYHPGISYDTADKRWIYGSRSLAGPDRGTRNGRKVNPFSKVVF